MKTIFTTWAMLLIACNVFSQRDAVLKAFEKYRIDPTSIDSLTQRHELRFNFDLTTVIVTEGNEKVYKAQHDAGKTGDSAWALKTVNNSDPSGLDHSTFRKQHSEKIPPPLPDNNTFRIIKDDGKSLIISYQYDPASLIDDNKFMQHCTMVLFFDAASGKLLRAEGSIEKSFKIKMFKANYLSSTVTYQYNETIKRYLPLKEEISINLNLLGRAVDMITTNEYSNYRLP